MALQPEEDEEEEDEEEEAEEEDEEHGNSVKIEITNITPVLRAFLSDIISFQHVPHFGVGINQSEWKLKVKTEIWAKIGQNDHSNPYYRKYYRSF